MRTSPNFEAFLRKVEETLPQHALIRPEDARAWWESLDEDPFNSEDWHLRRLRKIGGSESGILVAPVYGEPAPFDQTPAQLYDRKLMKSVLEQDVAMKFGHEHEDIARKMYESRLFGMGWERDAEGLKQLSDYIAQDKESSMAFSPDDLFVLKDAHGHVQKRLLTDYKSPYAGNIPGLRGEKDDPNFAYIAQLHHGKCVCEDAGLPVDELRLCILDHPDNLAHPKESRLMVLNIDYDAQLAADVCQSCDAMIDAVRSGQRPLPSHLYGSGKDMEKARNDLIALRGLQKKLVQYSIEEKVLSAQVKNIRDNMAAIAKEFVAPDGTVNKEELGIQVSPRVSLVVVKGQEEKLKSQLSEGEIEQVPDMEAVEAFLKEHGKSLSDFHKDGDPKMDVILEDMERRQQLLSEGILEPRISFAVPAKLTVEDLKDYDLPENAKNDTMGLLAVAESSSGSFRALLWHPESSTLWEVHNPLERDTVIHDDGCVEDVTGEPAYEEAFRLGVVPDLSDNTTHEDLRNPSNSFAYAIADTEKNGLTQCFVEGPFKNFNEAKKLCREGQFVFKTDVNGGSEMVFTLPMVEKADSHELSSSVSDGTIFVELDAVDDIDLGLPEPRQTM